MDREVSQKYLAQQIMSASPAKLVAMLYERAITLLRETVEWYCRWGQNYNFASSCTIF